MRRRNSGSTRHAEHTSRLRNFNSISGRARRRFGADLSFAGEPGLLLAGLGQDAAAFDRETCWAVLDHLKNPVGVDVGDPGYGGGDFRCETGGFVLWMP